jgi:ABC-2 type transport system ATP-binding protein
VQAVCDRIIIINRGKIVANELTENINRAVQSNRRFTVKICGPQREVLAALKAIPGMTYAEVLPERDGDAYLYTIESEVGTDVRKRLFTTIAERGWIMIGLEALGMSLEDIFINVVEDELIAPEENAKKPKATSRRKYDYESRNREIGRDIARQLRENASVGSANETSDGDNA